MAYERETFFIDKANGIAGGTAEIPVTEEGWWVVAHRIEEHQSWERPFMVTLNANVSPQWDGASLFCDTGEAFCHFEQAPHQFDGIGTTGLGAADIGGMLGGMLGFPFGGLAMPAMPQMPDLSQVKMPLPHTGRPDRAYPGADAYLDGLARVAVGPKAPLRCVWNGVAREKYDETIAREEKAARRKRGEYADYNSKMFTYVINKVLDRTAIRAYETEVEDGSTWYLFCGACLSGYDLLYYPARLGITTPPANAPFGKAQLGDAEIYQTMWMATRRFGGACPKEGSQRNEYFNWVINFGLSAEFDKAVMSEMREREKGMRQRDTEQVKRDTQELHRLNAQMAEDNRRRQQRLDEGRARSWERKQELDRRNRERWSAVNRGVDQFVGPHGELVEFRPGGPGSRAYYDHFSDTIVYTDRYHDGLEELPRWQW